MASGTLGADELTEKQRWGDHSKVYTRKFHNKRLKNDVVAVTTATTSDGDNRVTNAGIINNGDQRSVENCENNVPQQSSKALAAEDSNSLQQQEQRLNAVSDDSERHTPQAVALLVENGNGVIKPVVTAVDDLSARNPPPEEVAAEVENGNGLIEPVVNDSSGHNQPPEAVAVEVENGNGPIAPVITRVDDRVRINLKVANSKDEIRELRSKLVSELDQVRSLFKQLEAKEVQLSSAYSNTAASQSQHSGNDFVEGRALLRVHSEVGSVGQLESRPFQPTTVPETGDGRSLVRVNSELGSVVGGQDYRPFRQLSVSVMENNNHIHGVGELIEKEKRTPKANQYYRNSEFLLGKDRLPPESNKKAKSNGGRKHGGALEYGFGMDRHRNQAFKNCSNLLQRLMKHKHGWVFNEPVNAKLLGLHDYHDIIKHPMDLGTVKSRLMQNFYKSPRDFADDVRLTFRNAMTYNPKGQDVHVMAEQLSEIFEEKWAVIEAEYNSFWRYEMIQHSGLTTPTSRKGPPLLPALPMRTFDRSESMTAPKSLNFPVSRTPLPKKPKAKDPNKRDMTYEEKQKLSTNLQGLPSEKLDNIVQIIKKRNSSVSQHDDEIEVDIDSVDAETLWELDRFVTNYKKSLSKNKRKAELAQARAQTGHTITAPNPAPAVTVAPNESRTGVMNAAAASPIQAEKQHDNGSRSSSSSSSSSDSGSSSSDSDSDSSSAYGSDAAHSPRT